MFYLVPRTEITVNEQPKVVINQTTGVASLELTCGVFPYDTDQPPHPLQWQVGTLPDTLFFVWLYLFPIHISEFFSPFGDFGGA